MRRAVPLFVVVFGVLALFLDIVAVRVPIIGAQPGTVDSRKLEWKLGLDLQGGFRVEYQAQQVGDRVPDSDAMNTIRDIIERRVNATGVSEPLVYTVGSDRVVVELPGVQDAEAIEKLVGTTGRLDFVPLPGRRLRHGHGRRRRRDRRRRRPAPARRRSLSLFSGDQIETANPAVDSTSGQRAVVVHPPRPGQEPVRATSRARTSTTSSRSCSTTRSCRRRTSRSRSPTARARSAAASRPPT